jgi:phage-related protein
VEFTDEQIVTVMAGLGITQADLSRASMSERSLQALQRRVKKAYRKLVMELHPDRTNDDPDKARLFQLAGKVVEEIEKMDAHPNPRRIKWAVKIRLAVQETS